MHSSMHYDDRDVVLGYLLSRRRPWEQSNFYDHNSSEVCVSARRALLSACIRSVISSSARAIVSHSIT